MFLLLSPWEAPTSLAGGFYDFSIDQCFWNAFHVFTWRRQDKPLVLWNKKHFSPGNFTGWWFGTFFSFSIYWEFHHPNWRTHILQGGRSTTNQFRMIPKWPFGMDWNPSTRITWKVWTAATAPQSEPPTRAALLCQVGKTVQLTKEPPKQGCQAAVTSAGQVFKKAEKLSTIVHLFARGYRILYTIRG